jgi:MYXO-CTERM domain-containing protein
MKRSAAVGILVAGVFCGLAMEASEARADLVPPGQSTVDYSFKVTGLPANSDLVLLAYPCGTSNGRPTTDVRKLDDGVSVGVGRRGGNCTLYVVSKAKYTAFMASYKPADTFEDKPLSDFMAKATKCKGAPSPVFFVDKNDKRKSIEEVLVVKTMTATACEITPKPSTETVAATSASASASASAPSATASASASASVAPAASSVAPAASASATPAAQASAPPANKGCSAAPSGVGTTHGGAALLALAIVAGLRRRLRRTGA